MQNDRFERFSQRARKVLALAQEEAQRFNHNYIGTEHLLLGLIREGEGVAAKVLGNLGVDLAKARSAVEFIIGRGQRATVGATGLTPRSRTVIELAIDEAHRLGHHYVGTEHLLLGLVREGEGIAAGVLDSLGVRLDQVRQRTIMVLSQSNSRRAGDGASAAAVWCSLEAHQLAAVDSLVASGIRRTREEVVAWLLALGLQTQGELLARLGQAEGGAPPSEPLPGAPARVPPSGDQPGPAATNG